MFAPSIAQVSEEFHSMNADLGALTASGYLLGYVFCPFGIAPLSELYGRLLVYHIGTLSLILFNLVCVKSTNFPMLTWSLRFANISGSLYGSLQLANRTLPLANWRPEYESSIPFTYSYWPTRGLKTSD
jgi:MFS family permease